jgi:hypothetical protein
METQIKRQLAELQASRKKLELENKNKQAAVAMLRRILAANTSVTQIMPQKDTK